jgi:hypothetical protein
MAINARNPVKLVYAAGEESFEVTAWLNRVPSVGEEIYLVNDEEEGRFPEHLSGQTFTVKHVVWKVKEFADVEPPLPEVLLKP